jgi:glycine betaine/proline transport system permease protein
MWINDNKLALGDRIAVGVDWLTQHGSGVFDSISQGVSGSINGLTNGLMWFHPLVLIAVFTALSWLVQRSIALAVFVTLSFLLILNLGYWEETLQTLAQVTSATFICILIGVPLGIVSAHRSWFYTLLRPLLDLMQTVPTFVYLIPTLTLFGLGVVPGLISTVVFAIAAPIRLTYLGIRDVPSELLDAGKAFGCSRRQLLMRIELPYAVSSIGAGITQCIMLSLSMVVIAALVGADGLGRPVVNALNTADVALGFEAGLSIVLLAIMLDRICKQRDRQVGEDA